MSEENENITDLINDYLPKAPEEEIEQEETNYTDTEEETLTPKQMEMARSQIFQEYKKAQTKGLVKESKQTAVSMKDEISAIKDEFAKLRSENEFLKTELTGVKGMAKKHDDMIITKDYMDEEDKIAKHEKYGKLYDKQAIRDSVVKKARKERRYFSPIEELKLQKFDEIYEELLKNREILNRRNQFLSKNQGISQSALKEDEFSNVKTMKEAQDIAKRKFEEQFGLG